VSTSPDTLSGYILYSDASLYRLWGHLDDAVREGTNRWAQVFGSREALFDHYFRDESATAAFLQGMHGFGQLASLKVVRAFDLSRFRHLADLGGATGHLAIAACEAYPALRATVVDLPRVTPFARKTVAASSVADRIQIASCDFFNDELPPADLYYLGRILHDWSDHKTVPLLSRIFQALPAHGALLIGETLVDDDHCGPVYSLMQDLNMLVCTDGRERTAAEYRDLLSLAGFSRVEFQKTGAPIDAILASQ
jgi:acetylserotonin N-methyltransferase